MASKPQAIGPFPGGMDNRRPDFALSNGESGDLLRDAVNADITAQGTVKRRAGMALAQAGLDCHSLWSPASEAYVLYADAGDLYRLAPNAAGALTRTQIASGFGRTSPVSFCEVHEAVYYSDGLRRASYHPATGPTPAWTDAQPVVLRDVQYLPMPAGRIVAHHINRLLVANGSTLFYSEPFTPNLYDEAKGFVIFPARITLVVPVEGGVYVAADQTYFIPGGFPAQGMRAVLPYGALERSSGLVPNSKSVHWMSPRGVITGTADGTVANLQEAHIAIQPATHGASIFTERDGMRQIIAALTDPGETRSAVGDFADMEVVRKGIIL